MLKPLCRSRHRDDAEQNHLKCFLIYSSDQVKKSGEGFLPIAWQEEHWDLEKIQGLSGDARLCKIIMLIIRKKEDQGESVMFYFCSTVVTFHQTKQKLSFQPSDFMGYINLYNWITLLLRVCKSLWFPVQHMKVYIYRKCENKPRHWIIFMVWIGNSVERGSEGVRSPLRLQSKTNLGSLLHKVKFGISFCICL